MYLYIYIYIYICINERRQLVAERMLKHCLLNRPSALGQNRQEAEAAGERRLCPFQGSASSGGCCRLAVGATLARPVVVHRVDLDLLHDVLAPEQRAPVLEERVSMFATCLGAAVLLPLSFAPAATWP